MTVRPSPPFRDFEVSAILREVAEAGSGKSQFRRPLKPQPLDVEMVDGDYWASYVAGTTTPLLTPFAIGDLLWCRETWAHYQTVNNIRKSDGRSVDEVSDGLAGYREDGHDTIEDFREHIRLMSDCDLESIIINGGRWRSSTQMPRWASRLTLEVVGVKIERLQEISEDDARAEGVENDVWDMAPVARRYGVKDGWFVGWSLGINEPLVSVEADEVCRRSFETMWETVHGPGSWSANPLVAAVTFRPHLINVDEFLRQREGGR